MAVVIHSAVGNIRALTSSLLLLSLLLISASGRAESTCYGTTANGRLADGVKLPSSGANFVAYGAVPELAGRAYMHSKVRDIVVEAYQPDRVGTVYVPTLV